MSLFASLSERLSEAFRRLRGKGKLSEADVVEALREVRMALLEADVHLAVVRDFIQRVRERAVGQEVLESLTPAQVVIKIVHDELTQLMGGQRAQLAQAPKGPTVILMVGLQGSGKTTTAAKLAHLLRRQGRQVSLVAADLARPAAVHQLKVLGDKVGARVFSRDTKDPVGLTREALDQAWREGDEVVIVDTAGRLHIDETLMDELVRVKEAARPHEVLLVVDAMTGQDAVRAAKEFHDRLGIDGVVLTKLDGDARGGAALSVRQVTGRPIKFVGMGEQVDQLEPFHPERMASRILGMGDVLTLVEKAHAEVDQKKAEALAQKLRKQQFTLTDFLDQVQQVRKMGPLDQLLGMMPGFGAAKQLKNLQIDERELGHVEAIIRSMTPGERERPEIIDGSRRRRIARGSGRPVQEVNRLLRQFDETRKLMRQLGQAHGRLGRGGRFPM